MIKSFFIHLHNNYHSRLVALFASITFLLLFLSFITINGVQYQHLNDTLVSDHQRIFNDYTDVLDEDLFSSIHDIQSETIMTLKPLYTLVNPIPENPFIKNDFPFEVTLPYQRNLSLLKSNADYIEAIELYNFKYDTFISSSKSIIYDVSQKKEEFGELLPYELFSSSALRANMPSVTRLKGNSPNAYKNKICFTSYYPFSHTTKEAELMALITVSPKSLYDHLSKIYGTNPHRLMILDDNQEMLFDSDNYVATQMGNLSDIEIDQLLTDDAGLLQRNEGNYHFMVQKSSYYPLSYVYLYPAPILMDQLITCFYKTSTIFLLIVLVGIVLTLTFSKILYRPVRELTASVKNQFPSYTEGDDLSYLSNVLHAVENELTTYKLNLRENTPLILNNIAASMLNATLFSIEEIKPILSKLGYTLKFPHFFIAAIQLDPALFEELNYNSKRILDLYILDAMANLFKNDNPAELKFFSYTSTYGNLVFIINTNAAHYSHDIEQLHELSKVLSKELKVNANIAASSLITDLSLTHTIYMKTLGYFKYRFIYDYHNVFTEELISQYDSNFSLHGEMFLKNFASLLKKQDFALCNKELLIFYEEIVKENSSLLYLSTLSSSLLQLIIDEYHRYHVTLPNFGDEQLLSVFSQLHNIGSMTTFFIDLLATLEQGIQDKSVKINSDFTEAIQQYIDENCTTCSLNSTAEHFKISTGHLSRLFKKNFGITFSEYVYDAKLNHACTLLKTTSMKISDIAQEIGYYNIPYFNKIFKQKYNVTPSQFRKMTP